MKNDIKTKIIDLVGQNKSVRKIAEEVDLGYSTVRYYLSKLDIKTSYSRSISALLPDGRRKCAKCNEIKSETEFYHGKRTHAYCKFCDNKLAIVRQRDLKRKCIEYKGGKCSVCGYSKCDAALEFHHLNPLEKEFSLASVKSRNFDSLKKELDKCVLLCSNCHREVHQGLVPNLVAP